MSSHEIHALQINCFEPIAFVPGRELCRVRRAVSVARVRSCRVVQQRPNPPTVRDAFQKHAARETQKTAGNMMPTETVSINMSRDY